MKTPGERIRQARNARGISGLELARRVGYKKQSAISNLENRAGGTGGRRVGKIADELGVPVDWILRGPDGEKVPFLKAYIKNKLDEPFVTGSVREPEQAAYWPDPILREAHELLEKMSPAGRLEAITYLRFLAMQHTSQRHSPGGESDSIPNQKAA